MPGLKNENGTWNPDYSTCEQCGGLYIAKDMHQSSTRHVEWLKGELMGQEEVELPPQPPPHYYEVLPERLEFGKSILCPRCKGRGFKKCPLCKGNGIIPNIGA